MSNSLPIIAFLVTEKVEEDRTKMLQVYARSVKDLTSLK